MKKVFLLLILFSLSFGLAWSQTIQGTLINTAPQVVKVYAKPSSPVTNRLFRNINVCLSIPDQGPGNNPVVSVSASYIASLGWDPVPGNPIVAGGRAYYTFLGTDNGITTTTTWNVITNPGNPVAEFTFTNPNGFDQVQLNDETPAGGGNGQMFWYVEIIGLGDVTDNANKFYGAGAVNGGASAPSFVPAQPSSFLPAFFKEFNVTKQGSSNALLSWTTSQEQNVSHFVLERSLTQSTGWTKFTEVKAKGNSATATSYTFTDADVFDGRIASQTVFYRIKVVDLDGTEKLFPVRSVRFAVTSKDITIYPNPVKDGFYIQVPLENPRGNNKIKFNIVSRTGQILQTKEIAASMASNYYYELKATNIIPGEYMVQVIYGDALLDTKKIVVQR